jgi:hypothetical protein
MLAAGATLPVLSPDLFALFRGVHPAAGYALRTLNPQQNATVVAMIDQIIPETDTLGAKGVLVNEFIDVILTEWATDSERQNFLDGLTDVDRQSLELFGKTFVEALPAQQLALLRSMDEAAAAARSRRPPQHYTAVEARERHLQGDFFMVLKGITLHGYYTSEVGFTKELRLEIIPGALHGCELIDEAKKA